MRKFTLFFAVLLSLIGATRANADELTVYDGTATNQNIPVYGYYADTKGGCSEFIIPSSQLTSLNGLDIEQMVFYLSSPASASFGNASFNVYLEEVTGSNYDDSSASQLTESKTLVYAGALDATGSTMEIPFSSTYTYNGGNLLVAIEVGTADSYKQAYFYGTTTTSNTSRYKYSSQSGRLKFIPKTTFITPTNGPALAVKDGATKLSSPYAFNFGLATAGTEKTFTLSNPGNEALSVAVSETGDFNATLSATTIAAGNDVTLTVTMPAATGSSAVTITPAAESGIDPFVINVSGTIRDANKVYLEFSDGQIPDGWTSVAIGSYASSYGSEWAASEGYVSQSGSSSSYEWAFTSPKMTFAKDELIAFETAKYSSSTWYTPSIKVEYSLDGSSWTTIGSAFTDDTYGNWTYRSVTVPVEGVQYIRFSGWYIHMRNIYGGELPQEPNMKVTQPASLDFGVITEATAKTFTIANTGKATLEGISVTSSNNSIFSITGAPTSLAAGASATVTITMSATTTGALNSDITVSATDMEDVEFTVTGVVLPEGLATEEFNGTTIPANWTSSGSWTFATDGYAVGTNSSAYLYTPKLKFTEGDMVVITMAPSDTYSGDYLTINGSSDNGETYTAYTKKIEVPQGKDVYATYVVTDIPTTVNKIRFTGYYVSVDKIAGLTYAPVLSVTKAAEAVVSGSTYDFGESAADDDVTYNFANTGAGTINITAVGITGEGAAAYSTNWAEPTTAPFDLVISRTYNAEREGASVAIVTVTTSEGEFVINVTGTDKAANAPELAVTPDEGAAFGVVTEAAEKTYTVTNAGTGTLTVNIASNDDKFTVSADQLTDIAAGDSKTFKVIFTPVAETYGTFNANITVTPTYDAEAAVVIAASAKVKDPELWSEDFSGNAVPTGWNAGANWSIADGVAKASYAYGSTTYLTTPALTVADASDELTFGYETTANYVTIKIQYSKDGGAFTDFAGYPSSLSNGATGTFTITGLEAGEYQFRFANDDYQLDNFEGFKLNLPDHIAVISASTIPTSSSYSPTFKVSKSFEATVTVDENRGVEEALTAKLYMGEEVIGIANGNVAANGSVTLTITATPTVAATEGADMHIEVTYAGGTLKTANETRYVSEFVRLDLDEASDTEIETGTTYDLITLTRSYAQGWNTIVLPFAVSDLSVFGEGVKLYRYIGYDAENEAVNFTTATEINPATPYVIYLPEAVSPVLTRENTSISSVYVGEENIATSYSAWIFQGTYAPKAAGTLTGKYGLTTSGKIMLAGEGASLKGFRAYFTPNENYVKENEQGLGVKAIIFNDLATGIKVVSTNTELLEGLFDLSGRKVNAARKGIFVKNGKKMIVK